MRESCTQEVTFEPHLHLQMGKCLDLDGPGVRTYQQRGL